MCFSTLDMEMLKMISIRPELSVHSMTVFPNQSTSGQERLFHSVWTTKDSSPDNGWYAELLIGFE